MFLTSCCILLVLSPDDVHPSILDISTEIGREQQAGDTIIVQLPDGVEANCVSDKYGNVYVKNGFMWYATNVIAAPPFANAVTIALRR